MIGGNQVSYQGYGRTAIVSADGKTITVGGFAGGACGTMVTAVARETATSVRLLLKSVAPDNPPPCPQEMAALVEAQDITLKEPLGNRRLVDGVSGQAIAWISARLVLLPGDLPIGYRLRDFIAVVNVAGSQTTGPAGATQIYYLRHSPFALEIRQSAGDLRIPGPGPGGWSHIRVRGHPGLATRNLITWLENGLTDYIVVGTQNGPDEPQVLSTQQLIAIADSAPAYNTLPIPIPGRQTSG